MKLSLISPSRNNKKYLEWSYNSVRKHCDPSVEYCVADDFSNDGTLEWCQKIKKSDPNFKFIRNDGPIRLGHTILYDRLIEEVATGDVVMIWHADMYATPDMDKRILSEIGINKIVSLTRIEPSLHPPGQEKIIQDFGVEPEGFDECKFLEFEMKKRDVEKKTHGIFAPWAIMKSDFLAINGHDPLYAPQSREDSDIFNRFLLMGYETVQLWDTFVYHMTCRGSRFNPQLTTIGTMSKEWKLQNAKSERNFIRKWGNMVRIDENLKPVLSHKYRIGFHAINCSYQWLHQLEIWCSTIFISNDTTIQQYIKDEQPNTLYDLNKRVLSSSLMNQSNFDRVQFYDILIEFDCLKIQSYIFRYISDILTQTNNTGSFEYEMFKFYIYTLNTYEHNLIIADKSGELRNDKSIIK